MNPALTAEEWKLLLNWIREDGPLDPEAVGATFDSHGTAAACLYGQPFGFTSEDLSALRDLHTRAAEDLHDRGRDGESWQSEELTAAVRALASVIDRIAALLPPEGT